jgi:CBS domain-containing protein
METAVDPNPQVTEAAQVLDREVSEFMTSGVVAIPDDASLLQVGRAMPAHRVHAMLVLHASACRVAHMLIVGP